MAIVKGLVEFAAPFKSRVNLGRARGYIHDGETRSVAEGRFVECIRECADFAAPLGVDILLEPVNRYEINFVNSVGDAIALMATIARPNVKIMPDVFHMNIEDASITGSLERAALLWAIYHNFEPAQWRSERKRHYRYPGQSALQVAGVPPGQVSYLDALGM